MLLLLSVPLQPVSIEFLTWLSFFFRCRHFHCKNECGKQYDANEETQSRFWIYNLPISHIGKTQSENSPELLHSSLHHNDILTDVNVAILVEPVDDEGEDEADVAGVVIS